MRSRCFQRNRGGHAAFELQAGVRMDAHAAAYRTAAKRKLNDFGRYFGFMLVPLQRMRQLA